MRKTKSWKHNRKDRKQYIYDGKGRFDMVMLPINTGKYDTPFMTLNRCESCEYFYECDNMGWYDDCEEKEDDYDSKVFSKSSKGIRVCIQ